MSIESSRQLKFSENALVDHCAFFAHREGPKQGKITRHSLREAFESLGVEGIRAKVASVALMAILGSKCGKGYFSTELDPAEVATFATHSCSSRVFTPQDGTFDEEQWLRLQEIVGASKDVFTQADFSVLGEENASRSKAEHEKGWLNLWLDSKFSSGEFGLLMEVAADNEDGGEPSISRERLERFYRDGGEVFRDIAEARRRSDGE